VQVPLLGSAGCKFPKLNPVREAAVTSGGHSVYAEPPTHTHTRNIMQFDTDSAAVLLLRHEEGSSSTNYCQQQLLLLPATNNRGLLQPPITTSEPPAATAEDEQRLNQPGSLQDAEEEQRLKWPGSLLVVELPFTFPNEAALCSTWSCFHSPWWSCYLRIMHTDKPWFVTTRSGDCGCILGVATSTAGQRQTASEEAAVTGHPKLLH